MKRKPVFVKDELPVSIFDEFKIVSEKRVVDEISVKAFEMQDSLEERKLRLWEQARQRELAWREKEDARLTAWLRKKALMDARKLAREVERKLRSGEWWQEGAKKAKVVIVQSRKLQAMYEVRVIWIKCNGNKSGVKENE